MSDHLIIKITKNPRVTSMDLQDSVKILNDCILNDCTMRKKDQVWLLWKGSQERASSLNANIVCNDTSNESFNGASNGQTWHNTTDTCG